MKHANSMAPFLPYAHIPIDEKSFIFPITGLLLTTNKKLSIGNIDFVDRVYLKSRLIDKELAKDINFINLFSRVDTFAVVDLSKFGDYKNLCKDGDNSLALQLLKQTIGAMYISIYNKKPTPDNERRIIISDKGIHEVDEGLNSYMAIWNGKYHMCPNKVSELLIAKEGDIDVKNVQPIINILNKNIKDRSEFENKICKALELVYSILIEAYTSERVLKLTTLLNFIFNQSENHNFDSNFVGRKLKIIFNVIDKKEFLEEIPEYICPECLKTKDISPIMVDIYSRVRNNFVHGKIDIFTELAVINLKDYIPLKLICFELLKSITTSKELINCKDTKEFDDYIESKEAERIKMYKSKK
ncbi:hypothetical protein GKZ28_21980 [Clostridium chromiireducens]|uniref:Apea-like HEPN domain-containing protein n=1 Tax=Clostridium chromiireducens TaxID=225345 RepID=A0A964RR92_9CLOT|nr:hypothetical protein [Clostridium chromiireducens]MVX66349.1 hypothetical protein [Clostridium chromiireducens]